MGWRDRIWDQQWIEPLLPNYLKPLRDARIETEETREFISEAEDFLSDLSSLSELPRLNKTFKRNIKGYLYKVKIKPKKIHLELIDTKKSSNPIRKRIYITIYREEVKSDGGLGKCIDSTIYYQVDQKTIVRSVQKHPLFKKLFILLHQLDLSLSGKKISVEQIVESAPIEKPEEISETKQKEQRSVLEEVNNAIRKYGNLDQLILTKLEELHYAISVCVEDIALLDIEEKHHLNRLVTYDLPKLLEAYESLSIEQRKESYEDVIGSIHSMRSYVEKQDYELKSSRMDRMKQLVKLNQMRYQQNIPSRKKDVDE